MPTEWHLEISSYHNEISISMLLMYTCGIYDTCGDYQEGYMSLYVGIVDTSFACLHIPFLFCERCFLTVVFHWKSVLDTQLITFHWTMDSDPDLDQDVSSEWAQLTGLSKCFPLAICYSPFQIHTVIYCHTLTVKIQTFGIKILLRPPPKQRSLIIVISDSRVFNFFL